MGLLSLKKRGEELPVHTAPPTPAHTDSCANSPQTATQSTFSLFVLQTDRSITASSTLLHLGGLGTVWVCTGKWLQSFAEGMRNLSRVCLAFSALFLGMHKAEGQKGLADSPHYLICPSTASHNILYCGVIQAPSALIEILPMLVLQC